MDAVTEESARVMVAEAGATSFERTYLDCRLPVYRYLRTIAGSDDTAAELTAVAFERAFAAFGRLQAGRPVLPWLLRIARNAAIDQARRSRPMARLEEIGLYAEPAAATTPEDEVLLTERDAELRALVAVLPEPQRDAIALRYAAGLTAREIGGVIGKSEEATQKILSRALGALREALDAQR
jgi:RNA polymerase sigma-70 factor, ECF subfamily